LRRPPAAKKTKDKMMGPDTVEEISIRYEEDGKEVVRELDKAVLSKGAWATLVFRYQQWNPAKETYGEDKYSIRRYRKMNGEYRVQSKFTISGKEQAQKLVAVLQEWMQEEGNTEFP
jgi:hypothetical protein